MKTIIKLLLSSLLVLSSTGCSPHSTKNEQDVSYIDISEIPAYSGTPYVEIDGNIPAFTEDELSTKSYESYSELDELGRCGAAMANIGKDLMPTEERGSIGMIKPSGWHTVRYDDLIDGKYLYNRCHLIGFQLTGENANEKNLITGTRYMNMEGMLPFEDMVADHIQETNNHVLYRVTPIFEGKNLVASGVQMEAQSVEDHGKGIEFNVFVYNIQPGITIDYATGNSHLEKDSGNETNDKDTKMEIRGNKKSKIYHCPNQQAYDEMEDSKNLIIFHSEEEAQAAGYRKAQ
ncbi:MAG: DNA/RNA non-specific endonuclease [[Clostridium] innocuum]|nr:DNA/RNA non-specific endonuclease [[Clostridium] innocuum]